MAAGGGNVVVPRPGGKLLAWGLNWHGELGDGSGKDSSKPVAVALPAGVTAWPEIRELAAGGANVTALCADGSLLAWGQNDMGQLGLGFVSEKQLTPTRVNMPKIEGQQVKVRGIAASAYHTMAVSREGSVWSWGSNRFGQLGDGTLEDRAAPVPVKGLTGVVAVTAGLKHSLALRCDGTVWAWGDNLYGALGDGTNVDKVGPAQVKGLPAVKAIASGWHHSLALAVDGSVWAWGCNHFGQLGDGTTQDRNFPRPVRGLEGAQRLAGVSLVKCGGLHNLALLDGGRLAAWGWNYRGQLGDNTSVDRYTPVLAHAAMANNEPLAEVVAMAGGGAHTVAQLADGSLRTWGDNLRGQIGDGTLVAWMLGAAYSEPNGRGASEMRKSGHEYQAIRPGPMKPALP